ncbi:MAG: hypothetical protein HKN85_01735 [Gammaproteobacteria bacterium]|nr:hypothetical protein [Gammaproteobacteria bacterium]
MSAKKSNHRTSKAGRNGRRRAMTRWHRRIGLLSALAVLLLSTTGIALNHLDSLFDGNDFVTSEWLIDWYGIKPASEVWLFAGSNAPISSGQTDENPQDNGLQISWADGTISINQQAMLFNQGRLLGVTKYQDITHVFTASELHLFSAGGERIESITLSPASTITAVYQTELPDNYFLRLHDKTRLYDLNLLEWRDDPPSPLQKTGDLQSEVVLLEQNHPAYRLSRHHSLLKSKIIQDLHNGSFFGRFGRLVLDFFALCFIVLAGTGVISWYGRSRA